jgi:hypothetical protein
MAAVYDALLAAVRQHGAKLSLAADEPTENYLRRLTADVANLPLDAFQALTPEAQTWYDTAADALQAGLAVPAPDGFDRDAVAPPAATPGRITRPSASAAAPRHVLPPRAPAESPAIPIDPAEPLATQVSKLMIADQSLSIDDCMRQLHRVGVGAKRGSVIQLRNQALIFLRLLHEAGWRPRAH